MLSFSFSTVTSNHCRLGIDSLKQTLEIFETPIYILPDEFFSICRLSRITPYSANKQFAKVLRTSGDLTIERLCVENTRGNNGCLAIDAVQRVEISKWGRYSSF